MLPLALFLAAGMADWIPARWHSNDPKSLELVKQTPINCLLLESADWKQEFVAEAARLDLVTLAIVHPGESLEGIGTRVKTLGMHGVVFEGMFPEGAVAGARPALEDLRLAVIELGPRTRIRFNSKDQVLGTDQGLWPGINATPEESAKAAPSGAPWIDTNSGFLRFARSLTSARLWIACVPPKGNIYPVARYLQAVGDAAMVGARWVVALDAELEKRLLAREPEALERWKRIGQMLAFYEERKEDRGLPPFSQLALVQDIASGGLISGGILDMITVKHTPVRPVPARALATGSMAGAKLAINVDPASLDDGQKATLREFTRGGGTMLTGPPGWKFPPQRDNQITLDKEDIEKLDAIWKEVNSLTGRRNLGVRLFNVASMLSDLTGGASGRPLVLHMVNYSDYEVENVTVHLLGKYSKVRFFEPGGAPVTLETYEHEEGTGVDIPKVRAAAALMIE